LDSIGRGSLSEAEDGVMRAGAFRRRARFLHLVRPGAPREVSTVVSRTRKIVAAAAILAIGLVLAWPMRKTSPRRTTDPPPPSTRSAAAVDVAPADPFLDIGLQPSAPASVASTAVDAPGTGPAIAPHQTEATLATLTSTLVEPSHGLPGAPAADPSAAQPETRIHVVHNGDTLERLAKRYLGSESRALEIFDMNRDVLTNPHLLPIGAELRLPAGERKAAER